MTAGIQAGIVAQQSTSFKEKVELAKKGELCSSPLADEMYKINEKLRKIEGKEKCLRVQFLDWLSDKLLNWSNRVHVVASKIDSPCLIEVAPRKREQSEHAIVSKEIARLNELLELERNKNKGK